MAKGTQPQHVNKVDEMSPDELSARIKQLTEDFSANGAKLATEGMAYLDESMTVARQLQGEIASVRKAQASYAERAESGARGTALADFKGVLSGAKLTDLAKTLKLEGRANKDANGNWELQFIPSVDGIKANELISDLIGDKFDGLTTFKGIKFSTDGTAEYVGTRKPSTRTGNGGGGGRGWTHKDHGGEFKLSELFNENATDEDKAKYEAIEKGSSAGSKQFNLKSKVAKEAGYILK